MKKKLIWFILVALLVTSFSIFGCVEKKPTISQISTAEIKLMVEELGYNDDEAQYIANEVNNWKDEQGYPFLQKLKGELDDKGKQYDEGKSSADKLAEVEIKITQELSQKIKKEIPEYESYNWDLENVIIDKRANCVGYTQLFFILGESIGLSIEPLGIIEDYSVESLELEIQAKFYHAACLVNLTNGDIVFVDLTSSPPSISIPILLDNEYEEKGNYLEAKNRDNPKLFYTRILIYGKDGLISSIFNIKGFNFQNNGEYHEAISSYTIAIEVYPKNAIPYNNRGSVYLELGEYQKAISDSTMAIELDPKFIEAYINRGNAYNFLGEFQKAITEYTMAIKLDPEYAVAYNYRGSAYYFLGEYQKAISECTIAIELNPKYAEAYNSRGSAYYFLGEYQKAISEYTMVIELDPEYAAAYNNRGLANYNLGEYQKAISEYTMAIELDPIYAEAYNNRGLANCDLGEYQKAIQDCNIAIELDPKNAKAYNNRGLANYYLREFQEAIKDFNMAIELNQKLAEAYNNRGSTYYHLGEYQKAIQDFNMAVELNPKYTEANNNLKMAIAN